MSVNHVLTRSFKTGNNAAVVAEKTVAVDSESVVPALTISDGEDDHFEAWQVDISRAKTIFMQSTKDVTICTNAPEAPSGAPDQTIELLANQPIIWAYGDQESCPITADVNSVYITNGSGEDAEIDLVAGHQ